MIILDNIYLYRIFMIGESPRLPTRPNTDPLSYLSRYKSYQKIIYT